MYMQEMSHLFFVLHSPCKEGIEQVTLNTSPAFLETRVREYVMFPHQGFNSLETECVGTELRVLKCHLIGQLSNYAIITHSLFLYFDK